ncbi:sodium-dependent proline transporter-like isoform X2 [Branchiostoma floridae x Branchiostoma japonicum]
MAENPAFVGDDAAKGTKTGVSTIRGTFNKDPKEIEAEQQPGDDEAPTRDQWDAKIEFLLSMIGYCVGLGNVWRFPYLCYRNGGGAFLIPYVIMLVFAGIPMFFIELTLGQYAGLGSLPVWNCIPILKGIGWAMCIISAWTCIYYNMIIAWALYYLFASFTSVLPWHHCGHWWNSDACVESWGVANKTANGTNFTRVSPSEEYWHVRVQQISSDIGETGKMNWELSLCLLLAWIFVFLCLFKGVKSTGKVVYITATFPYIILVILLVRGATLPGALDGILFYITPDLNKLRESQVWYDAASQIFYSIGIAFGGVLTMSSYNKFNNNCQRDAVFVPLMNCGTSVFAGFAVFSFLGFMAHELNVDVKDVVATGPGLVFIAYPEALTLLPASPFWAICLFFMLFMLGLDSMFVTLETIITALVDEFPTALARRKTWLLLGFCVAMYLLGLTQCTQAGIYWVTLMDWYAAGFCLIVTAFFMAIGICWIYGIKRFSSNIKDMIGHEPSMYFKVCWMFVSPALMLFIFIFSLVTYSPVEYNGKPYPGWGVSLGLLMAFSSIIAIPLFAIFALYKQEGSFLQRLRAACRPTASWGPSKSAPRPEEEVTYNYKSDSPYPLYDPRSLEYDMKHNNGVPGLANGTKFPLYDPRSLEEERSSKEAIANGGDDISDNVFTSV